MSKTSNIFARVEPNTKEQAEAILSSLGISMSNAIDMFLKQVVINKGIPFELKLEPKKPLFVEELTKEELDAAMHEAMDDIKENRLYTPEEVKMILNKTNEI